jgi:hypothetical protein
MPPPPVTTWLFIRVPNLRLPCGRLKPGLANPREARQDLQTACDHTDQFSNQALRPMSAMISRKPG